MSDIQSLVSSIIEDKESWDFFELKPSENIDEQVNRESAAQFPMVQNSQECRCSSSAPEKIPCCSEIYALIDFILEQK